MMRKIVVPTDFSENAFNALKYAVELFKYEKCEFFLLHAFADEVYNDMAIINKAVLDDLKDSVQVNSEKEIAQIILDIKEYSPNPHHHFNPISEFGSLVDEINEVVNKENADIVIMGTRGKTNYQHITFGSNTLQVIKYVHCPVLSIPENYEFKTPKNFLFPTNYMIPYQKRELKLVAELSRSYRAIIHLLYISEFPVESFRQKDNQLFLKEQFYETGFKFHREEEPDKIKAINKNIGSMNIDLLIMVNSRYTYLETILSGSTIDILGLQPKIPFLILQNFYREIT
ncbi:MAG: universal stress protein [Bacteroidota bacterium]